jgi:hypothetical protein
MDRKQTAHMLHAKQLWACGAGGCKVSYWRLSLLHCKKGCSRALNDLENFAQAGTKPLSASHVLNVSHLQARM